MRSIKMSDKAISEAGARGKAPSLFRPLFLKIDGDSVVVDEQLSENHIDTHDPKNYFEEIRLLLPPDEARYVIFDYKFKNHHNRIVIRRILMIWLPGTASIQSRMLYIGTTSNVSRNLESIGVGVRKTIKIQDEFDFDYKAFKSYFFD